MFFLDFVAVVVVVVITLSKVLSSIELNAATYTRILNLYYALNGKGQVSRFIFTFCGRFLRILIAVRFV